MLDLACMLLYGCGPMIAHLKTYLCGCFGPKMIYEGMSMSFQKIGFKGGGMPLSCCVP